VRELESLEYKYKKKNTLDGIDVDDYIKMARDQRERIEEKVAKEAEIERKKKKAMQRALMHSNLPRKKEVKRA